MLRSKDVFTFTTESDLNIGFYQIKQGADAQNL
jgi:hypothetical protein